MEDRIIESAMDIFLPVLESSMILAGHYAKHCNRDVVTAMDVDYAMKYVAMNHVGKHVGSLFPEIYDESSSESDEDFVEDECEFTRYSGNDEYCVAMNKAFDEWSTWVPENDAEKMIKKSIDEKAQVQGH
jgi:hypothetical protein